MLFFNNLGFCVCLFRKFDRLLQGTLTMLKGGVKLLWVSINYREQVSYDPCSYERNFKFLSFFEKATIFEFCAPFTLIITSYSSQALFVVYFHVADIYTFYFVLKE